MDIAGPDEYRQTVSRRIFVVTTLQAENAQNRQHHKYVQCHTLLSDNSMNSAQFERLKQQKQCDD